MDNSPVEWAKASFIDEKFGIPLTTLKKLVASGNIKAVKTDSCQKQATKVYSIKDVREYLEKEADRQARVKELLGE